MKKPTANSSGCDARIATRAVSSRVKDPTHNGVLGDGEPDRFEHVGVEHFTAIGLLMRPMNAHWSGLRMYNRNPSGQHLADPS